MIENILLYIKLFFTFAKIALFNFGGGFVMISLIGNEIINNGWLSANEFSDVIAISQMTPGAVAINTATYVGFKIGGVIGSVVATLAIPIPSFIIVALVSPYLIKYKDHKLNKMIFYGIRPVVVGLIINAAYIVAKTTLFYSNIFVTIKDFFAIFNLGSLVIFILSMFLLIKTKINPIIIIIISAILGVVIFTYF